MLTWDSSLETGVSLIDNEHKELIKKISDVLDASMQEKGLDSIKSTLDFLSEYAVLHFSHEEELQKNSSYQKYEEHKKQHIKFLETVNRLVEVSKKDGANLKLVLDVNKLVVDWLINHINLYDKHFADYYKAHNN